MKTCVFPGSFDPVTNGHLDLISRAAKLFDRVTVTVMINRAKKGRFSPEERVRLLEKACAELDNVVIDRWDGLLADYMKARGERCVIRGVRTSSEYEAESLSAAANAVLDPDIETLLIFASPGMSSISSSTVCEIASFGGDIRPFVPESAADEIIAHLKD